MTTRGEFAWQVLVSLGCEPNSGNVCGLVSQMHAENCEADWNPCATTLPWPGAAEYNSAGVRNYPSLADGIAATVATLNNGFYGAVLQSLHGNSAGAVCDAWSASRWGTEPFTPVPLIDPAVYDVPVGGSALPIAPPPPGPPLVEAPHPPVTPPSVPSAPLVQEGATGFAVMVVQRLVGATVDGIFGPVTTVAVRAFQQSRGLAVDGIVGALTWGQLLGV